MTVEISSNDTQTNSVEAPKEIWKKLILSIPPQDTSRKYLFRLPVVLYSMIQLYDLWDYPVWLCVFAFLYYHILQLDCTVTFRYSIKNMLSDWPSRYVRYSRIVLLVYTAMKMLENVYVSPDYPWYFFWMTLAMNLLVQKKKHFVQVSDCDD